MKTVVEVADHSDQMSFVINRNSFNHFMIALMIIIFDVLP
jgi:hypothetical protein